MKRILWVTALLIGLLLVSLPASAEMPPSCSYWDANGDHDWYKYEIMEPSCEIEGYFIYRCKVCGWTKKESTGGGQGHEMVLIDERQVDCVTHGYQIYECLACGERIINEYPAWGHGWEVIEEFPATCLRDGGKRLYCANCDSYMAESYPATGAHNWVLDFHHEQDCLAGTYDRYKCSECHFWEDRNLVGGPDMSKHDFHFDYEKPMNCKEAGYTAYKCWNCGVSDIRDWITSDPEHHLDALLYEVPATCEDWSIRIFECTVCGRKMQMNSHDPLGHDWVDEKITWQGNCVQDGTMQTKCSVCGQKGSRSIGRGNHEYGEQYIETEATDCSMGVYAQKCIRCDAVKQEEFYPEGTLYRGCTGNEVADIQTMLADLGHLNAAIDGSYGAKTEGAVSSYQLSAGLTTDGIAWPQTIKRLREDWNKLQAELSATPTPAPLLYCTYEQNESGISKAVYCSIHQVLSSMKERAAQNTAFAADGLALLKWEREVLQAEVDYMYDLWSEAAGENEEEVKIALNARASFTVQLTIQESVINQQYAGQPEMAAAQMNSMLSYHCAELCQKLYEYNSMRAVTPNGFVMAVAKEGWKVEQPMSADELVLNNAKQNGARIVIYDTQENAPAEEAAIAQQYYPGKGFVDLTIGGNSYKYNTSSDGRMFDLIAVTSTGNAVRIHAENCTMEQAAALLENIVIR